MTHYGLDVSSNNPDPKDWPAAYADLKARGGGAQPFAIVKATQGTGYVNPDEPADAAGAAKAGFAVAAYLMDQGDADPAAEEALFKRVAGGLPQFDDDELPMGNTAYAQHCAALLAQNPAAGDYLNQSEEDQGFPAGAVPWEANYNRQPGVTHRAGVLIHQYDDQGTVAGISGEVDLNVFLGSEAQFAAIFHTAAPAAPTPITHSEGATPVFVGWIAKTAADPGGQYLIADNNTYATIHAAVTGANLVKPVSQGGVGLAYIEIDRGTLNELRAANAPTRIAPG